MDFDPVCRWRKYPHSGRRSGLPGRSAPLQMSCDLLRSDATFPMARARASCWACRMLGPGSRTRWRSPRRCPGNDRPEVSRCGRMGTRGSWPHRCSGRELLSRGPKFHHSAGSCQWLPDLILHHGASSRPLGARHRSRKSPASRGATPFCAFLIGPHLCSLHASSISDPTARGRIERRSREGAFRQFARLSPRQNRPPFPYFPGSQWRTSLSPSPKLKHDKSNTRAHLLPGEGRSGDTSDNRADNGADSRAIPLRGWQGWGIPMDANSNPRTQRDSSPQRSSGAPHLRAGPFLGASCPHILPEYVASFQGKCRECHG
jgi:hypothetical protein